MPAAVVTPELPAASSGGRPVPVLAVMIDVAPGARGVPPGSAFRSRSFPEVVKLLPTTVVPVVVVSPAAVTIVPVAVVLAIVTVVWRSPPVLRLRVVAAVTAVPVVRVPLVIRLVPSRVPPPVAARRVVAVTAFVPLAVPIVRVVRVV